MARIAVAAIIGATSTSPFAQGHGHDHGPKHGGQYVEVEGEHGIEMVATSSALTFHLTDDGKPMDLTGAQFRAVIQSGSVTTVVPLKVESGALTGPLAAPLTSGAIIVVSGKDRHGHPLQGRFVNK